MTLSSAQIRALCDLGQLRIDGGISASEAADRLQKESGVNRSSAYYYVDAMRQMHLGEMFPRSISAPIADAFVDHFSAVGGLAAAARALKSLRGYIEAYEGHRGGTLHKMRAVVERHESVMARVSATVIEPDFDLEVARLRADPEARARLLPVSGHRPARTTTSVTVFVRSAAVVAAVLERAEGICEICRQPAPFIRKTDGSAYLEIHHLVTLAEGGEDTVENVVAACPNCHRQSHYG